MVVSGDKSLSIRWVLLASLADGKSKSFNLLKSDDVIGRAKTYESIVKGDPIPQPGIPESFKVLLNEMKGFGLKIKMD